MTKHNIEFAGTMSYTRGTKDKAWEATATIDRAKLPTEIVAELAEHGLRQKIADAASQAKNADEASAMMQKCIDALLAGEWAVRGTSDGASFETIVGRSVMRNAFKEKVGAKSAAWAEFTGLSDADQVAKLDAWLAGPNGEALADAIAAEIEIRKARAANKAKAAKAVDFNL
jgi:hypothetical protein